MLLLAAALALTACVGGVYVSFFIDSAPAPTIVVVLALMFVVAFVCKARRLG